MWSTWLWKELLIYIQNNYSMKIFLFIYCTLKCIQDRVLPSSPEYGHFNLAFTCRFLLTLLYWQLSQDYRWGCCPGLVARGLCTSVLSPLSAGVRAISVVAPSISIRDSREGLAYLLKKKISSLSNKIIHHSLQVILYSLGCYFQAGLLRRWFYPVIGQLACQLLWNVPLLNQHSRLLGLEVNEQSVSMANQIYWWKYRGNGC